MPDALSFHRASRKRKSQMAQAMVHRLHEQGVPRGEIAARTSYSYDNVCRIISGSYLRKQAKQTARDRSWTWALRQCERHTVPAEGWHIHANGCRTKVTADTAEQAERLLRGMA